MLKRSAVLLVLAAALVSGATAAERGLAVGSKAPDFTLRTVAGQKVTLSALTKKSVVLLNFWFAG